MTDISFSGTRKGMNDFQKGVVHAFLEEKTVSGPLNAVFHGAAKGADTEFHELVCDYIPCERIVIYPSTHPQNNLDNLYGLVSPVNPGIYMASFGEGDVHKTVAIDVRPRADPLVRNHWIVEPGEFLLAAPAEVSEILRSGTWAAIRYARRLRRKIVIVYPDHRIVEE